MRHMTQPGLLQTMGIPRMTFLDLLLLYLLDDYLKEARSDDEQW